MKQFETQLAIQNENAKIDRLNELRRKLKLKDKFEEQKINKFLIVGQELKKELEKKSENEKIAIILNQAIEKAERLKNEMKQNSKIKRLSTGKVIEAKEEPYITPYSDKYEKILYYVDKYNIPLSISGDKRTYRELAQLIRKYELKNKMKLLKNKHNKFDELGLYIKLI
jgi:hypothetical protein